MKLNSLAIIFALLCHTAMADDLHELVSQYEADKYALTSKYTVVESAEYYERFTRFYTDWLATVKRVEFTKLSQDGKVDYILLKNQIDKELYFLKIKQKEFEEVAYVADFATPGYIFIRERRRGKSIEAASLAAKFNDMLLGIKTTKEKIAKAPPFSSWQKAEKASEIVKSLRENLEESYKFYKGYDPLFTWWMQRPYDTLASSLKVYEAFLKQHYVNTSVKDDGSGIIGRPIGRDALIKSLQTEFISYTPEEIIAIAQKQFAWCDAEMLKASQAMGFGNNWKAAMEKVKNTYVPAGQQPALIDSLAEEAIRFIEERNLITVPLLAKETWRMRMMSPEAQKVNPFFLGGEEIIVSYPTNTMEHREKMMSMRGNNPHFSRATVQHELIPGHHLQQFMNARYKPYRYAFYTPFWIEGWALYWEFNLWDKNFPRSPEDRIGMLFWRMHRCARIIFSLNYHLGKMTPQQCIDFLVERVGHEYANAAAEVRRSFTGDYGPLYQIAYMVGGLQFYNLKKDLVESGKMTEKDFHDRILKEGSIPVELVRAILTNQPLTEEYKATWKFDK
ncbi:MAG TPA: DUF885 family protein [Ohtaekwangia sp.]|uniref:DUF885 family protein n=1 Tax=Ohtaekwangia sp. TaxID=2066019 RepID=UPI002F92CCDC